VIKDITWYIRLNYGKNGRIDNSGRGSDSLHDLVCNLELGGKMIRELKEII